MKRTWGQQFKSALAGMLLGILVPTLAAGPVFAQATLLPNAKQQYLDDAADPVASGHVDLFVPNTSTRKTVWSDSAKTTPLPNPVLLDAAGRPQPTGQIYGDGSYRQRVVDQNGITIWDAVTSSTGGSGGGGSVAASEGVMVGTIIPWANITLPAKYLYTAGQAISRVTYPDLLTAITHQLTILCQLGIATITVPTSVSDSVPIGAPVEFSCFAPGTTVASKASGSLTLSTNATVTTSVSGRILPWGNGDGSTTFNVPNMAGRTAVGRNNMNGVTGAMSSLYYLTNPNAINAIGGSPSATLLLSNLPPYTPSGTNTGAAGNFQYAQSSANWGAGANNTIIQIAASGGAVVQNINMTQPTFTGNAAPNGGIAASATVGAGGSGYTAGVQLLTVSGGTCTTQPQFNVTIAAGAITAPVLATPGLCSVAPSNPAATTGGGGSGGTLNLLYSAAPVSIVQPSITVDYIIKALPDDAPTTPGVTSIQGMTGAIACAGSLVCTGNTISVTVPANGVSSVGGMTGAIGCGAGLTCGAGTVSVTPVADPSGIYATRTLAATQDLTAFGAVRTMGYTTAGDGGDALFKNVGSTPFRDSFVTAVTLTGNGTSGCTNGTYRNKQPSGGTGTNLILNMVVAGNVVTTVTIEETGGNGYTVADVLTTTVTGCASNVTVSVTTVSTPTCSFTDVVGNHMQIVYSGSAPFVSPKQCGAIWNYAGSDGSATNDFAAIQNTISYCADIHPPTIDGGGSAGCRIFLPPGNALICGGVPLNVPLGVTIEGSNMWGSTIKICAAWGAGANFINICDPDTQASCFASYLRNFTLYAPFSLGSSSAVSAIYSNSIQQVDILDRVAVYAGRRRCLTLEVGYGGAALLGLQNFECTPGDTSTTNAGILINYGTTLVNMRNTHVETGGPNTHSGIVVTGGFVTLNGFHTENIATGVEANITGSIANGFVRLYDLTGGGVCTNLVLKQGGSVANSVYVSGLTQNGCTNSMNNGGVLTTTFIGAWTLF